MYLWSFRYFCTAFFYLLFYNNYYYVLFLFWEREFSLLSMYLKEKCFPLPFKFLHVQLLAGQHSILRDVWIMMDILLPLPQLMQLQQVVFLLGIGEKPLEMVTLQLICLFWNYLNRHLYLWPPSSCVLWMSTILLKVRAFCLWVECPLYDLPKWVRSRPLLWIMSLLASFFFGRAINKWFLYVDFIVLYSLTCRWGESVILWEGNISQVGWLH